jgi:putative tricarboxylic transport membrane protein
VAAIFMGGLMMHGLNPGMELFTRNKDVLYTLFFGLAVGNFLIFLCGVGLAKVFARITTVPVNLLVPGIIILGVVSTYLYRSNFTDVLVAIVAGIFGYVLRRQGYSLVPLLVGFILAPIAERSFFQALIIADGSYLTFVRRPISAILFALIVLAIFLPPLLQHLRRRGKEG